MQKRPVRKKRGDTGQPTRRDGASHQRADRRTGEPLTACTHGTHAKRADRDVGRAGGLSVRSDPHSAAPGAHALGALAEARNDMRAQGEKCKNIQAGHGRTLGIGQGGGTLASQPRFLIFNRKAAPAVSAEA